jgi:hypothetical protein
MNIDDLELWLKATQGAFTCLRVCATAAEI